MKHEAICEAASVEEALDCALEELGVQQDAVEYEIIEEPGKRLFGLGGEKLAKVRAWLKADFVREMGETGAGAEEVEDSAPNVSFAPVAQVPVPELTDEELDKIADQAVSSIQTILDSFGIEATVEEYEGDDGELILDVVGGELGVLIGRHGKTLDSIQTLVAAISNRKLGFRYPVLVDVEGYRNRRRVKLEEIGHRAAERAIRTGQAVKLRPMSSYERKVVHVLLRDDARVVTVSEGEEPFRQVVVQPR